MNIQLYLLVSIISITSSSKSKVPSNKTTADIKKILEEHEQALSKHNKAKSSPVKITNYSNAKITPPPPPEKPDELPKIISPYSVQKWAEDISKTLHDIEKKVVRPKELLKGFSDVKMEVRDGAAIVDRTATSLEELLLRRVHAAEQIMRKAEEIATPKQKPPDGYTFDYSIFTQVNRGELWKKNFPQFTQVDSGGGRWAMTVQMVYSGNLDQTKQMWKSVEAEKGETLPTCISVQRIKLDPNWHFDTPISLEKTSVHVSAEVFPCDWRVLPHISWSEGLLSTFQKNYAQDSTIDFQYFCSAKGFLRHYPASLWDSNFKTSFTTENDVYDCRLRPWYVSAEGAPRDVLILIDASGSMNKSVNEYVAEQFTLAMLSALTDDDQVNVLRFNVQIESPISCFNDRLVPANHVNSAAMMAAMKPYDMHNETWMSDILESAVRLLQRQHGSHDRPPSCQQAIVLLTDSMEENHTMLMRHLDPYGRIRLFILWLHDPNGLRDDTRANADYMSCDRDGFYTEFITHADVTEQVMKILRLMERPLVAQRKERLRVFSDMYAHVEDPRRGENQWKEKEHAEQMYRYQQLRKNKANLLSPSQLYKDHYHQESLDKFGFYYEGDDVNYRLQISVSVPVFENTTVENITIVLDEEKQRNSTRTVIWIIPEIPVACYDVAALHSIPLRSSGKILYPVNRLLGVAGVDIPIDHLKLMLPYHQVGGGGSLFLIDHRGNIVLHDNIKPTFNGDILKPGYRTVDIIDLEQPAIDHPPRHYPNDWLKFRKSLVIEKEKGNMTMYGKSIFEGGLRVHTEMREYHWKRVLNHYTAVVVLPPYSRQHVVPETTFSMQIAEKALKALSGTDFAVQPDWLYCRHIEPHFDNREAEVLHFIRRRSDEPDFAMKKTKHDFSPIPPTLLEKTYQCDEELMAKLCKEAIATEKWAREHEEPDTDRDCSTCELGSSTAFFASESGLTRWQQYHATSQHASPPSGAVWSHGPTEAWYRRAAARPGTLVLHAPVAPVRKLRNTFLKPPPLGPKSEWLTASRTLSSDKGLIGVSGFHFYPQNLVELLISVTEMPCYAENKSLCKPRCEDTWSCVLVDEGGWVVARNSNESSPIEDVREHLATLHPAAMAALRKAGVFQVNWVHDYQGVCFPPWFNSAASSIPSLLKALWYSMKTVLRITQQIFALLAYASTTAVVSADTEKEKEKRRRRLKHDYDREQYEQLYDPRVLINKTVFAACDRTRPFYQLHHSQKSIEALSRTPTPAQLADCSWPLVGAFVPGTNLLLLALYNCETPYTGRPLPNPLHNKQYIEDLEPFAQGITKSPASKLACWRHRVPLPGRMPHTACFPHNYSQEANYRQCGPWLPDPEKEDESNAENHPVSKCLLLVTVLLNMLSKYTVS